MSLGLAQLIDDALRIRASHAQASPVEVLDLVMEGRSIFGDVLNLQAGAMLHPRTPFGQLLAQALDRTMTPQEWFDWSSPQADPTLRAGLLRVWQDHVLEKLLERYPADDLPVRISDDPRQAA